jgi:NADH dehydrogenase
LTRQPTVPFKYFDKGSLATIGRNIRPLPTWASSKFQGFFAWMIWMFVHLISLLGFRNKLVVFINWVGSYLTYNGGARLIIREYTPKAATQKKGSSAGG